MDLTIFKLVLTSLCCGLVISGLILFLIATRRNMGAIYQSMVLLGLIALIYGGAGLALLIHELLGAQAGLASQLVRIQDIAVASLLGIIPYFNGNLNPLGPRHRRVNQVLLFAGLGLALIFMVLCLVFPDLVRRPVPGTGLPTDPGFLGRGEPGPLVFIRDALVSLYALYFMASTAWDFLKKGKNKTFLPYMIGAGLACVLGFDHMVHNNFHWGLLTPLGWEFPRLLVGLTIFILFSMSGSMHAFLVKSQQAELAQHEMEKNRSRMIFLAFHDQWTGLPNRTSFFTKLEEAFDQVARTKQNKALFYMDLDNLKEINNSLGHHVGDLVIIEAAKRIKETIRTTDRLFRLGGDEFGLILNELHQATDAAIVAQKIIRALDQPVISEGRTIYTGISIGIAIFPKDAHELNDLVKKTNDALSVAKRTRRDFQFFTESMNTEAVKKLQIINGLKESLAKNTFDLHYQPLVGPGGRVEGVEALIRWNSPTLGAISPELFIPLAESTGLIQPIGNWVLKRAFADLQKLNEAGFDIFFSINISTKQLNDPGLYDFIDQHLKTTGIPVDQIHLEITESALIEGSHYRYILDRLSDRGITLVIDDFGMGYSSLSYLKSLPVKSLKIDKSFISPLPGHNRDNAIVKSIMDLALGLEMQVVAEGVETQAQSDYLRSLNCDLIQGYFFSRPLPFHELLVFLSRQVI